jgi:hypothetical protein
VAPSDSVQATNVLGFVNVPRTQALLFDVYHLASAARQRPVGWVDQPSEGILRTYALLYQGLSQPLAQKNPLLGQRALAAADSIFRNTDFGRNLPN